MAWSKLVAKIIRVHKLFPEHSKGSTSAFVVVTFDSQQFRTSTKFKDVSPSWNESFYFDMSDEHNLDKLALEASVYGVDKSIESSRSLLGKVSLCVTPDSTRDVMYYPLLKNGVFPREAKGVLALQVCITNEVSIRFQEPMNNGMRPLQFSSAMRLCVEVVSAHDLLPKDEQGSASTCVKLSFDYHQFQTTVKEKDLNPMWNERFYFDVWDPSSLSELVLEACVYNVNRSLKGSKSSLGVVRLNSYSFLSYSDDAATSYHPLEQSGMFSPRVTGGLRLRVYITSEPSRGAPNPISLPLNQSSAYAISFEILKQMTNNFSTERKLGQGSSGVVYKGVLKTRETIAVKKIVPSWMPGSQEQFQNEVYHLMMLKHPNIVRFLGYCYETWNEVQLCNGKHVFAEVTERLLCLEYLPKGSLDKHLSDESSGLDWSTRYNIIEGICYGLCHLHEQTDTKIIHLDLKPANILLDDRMVPKITDFGLSRLLDQQQTLYTESRHGTFGYMPPEIFHGGTITPKSDIFSLGVIIMEVITGHKDYPDVTRESPDDYIERALTKWRVVLQISPCNESLETYSKQIKRCIQVILSNYANYNVLYEE
ncbi:myosin-15-like [Hordeum vulgare]|nr:myosin-15-like [Hordeum vulgare]